MSAPHDAYRSLPEKARRLYHDMAKGLQMMCFAQDPVGTMALEVRLYGYADQESMKQAENALRLLANELPLTPHPAAVPHKWSTVAHIANTYRSEG